MMQTGILWVWKKMPSAAKQVLYPLSERVFSEGFRLKGSLNGFRLKGHGSFAYAANAHEPAVCNVLERIVRPGSWCVDVGAHLGYFTLLLAKLAGPTGHVTAFEAHPDNATQLRENIDINGLNARVKVEQFAISDGKQGTLPLYSGRASSAYEWNIVGYALDGKASSAVLEVPATSLDIYFPPSHRVDLVKLDIEGAEALAIHGMKRIMDENRPNIMVEFHNEDGWQGIHDLLEADYCLYDVDANVWLDNVDTRVYHVLAVPSESRPVLEPVLQSAA